MSDKDTLYARWLSGDLSAAEEEALKASGEWEELEAIIRASEGLTLPTFDAEVAYKQFKNKGATDKTSHLKAVPKGDEKPQAQIRRLAWRQFGCCSEYCIGDCSLVFVPNAERNFYFGRFGEQ